MPDKNNISLCNLGILKQKLDDQAINLVFPTKSYKIRQILQILQHWLIVSTVVKKDSFRQQHQVNN